jgi:predicted nucleic-acid-binding Zn-ribbon protein
VLVVSKNPGIYEVAMQNGKCPKCNSTEIYRGNQSPLHAGEGLVHLEAYPPNRGVNLLVDAYVCTSCGYVEMYVTEASKSKMTAIIDDKKNWQKAG